MNAVRSSGDGRVDTAASDRACRVPRSTTATDPSSYPTHNLPSRGMASPSTRRAGSVETSGPRSAVWDPVVASRTKTSADRSSSRRPPTTTRRPSGVQAAHRFRLAPAFTPQIGRPVTGSLHRTYPQTTVTARVPSGERAIAVAPPGTRATAGAATGTAAAVPPYWTTTRQPSGVGQAASITRSPTRIRRSRPPGAGSNGSTSTRPICSRSATYAGGSWSRALGHTPWSRTASRKAGGKVAGRPPGTPGSHRSSAGGSGPAAPVAGSDIGNPRPTCW